jgi:Zn-finger nucleic acid-binding protein
MPAAEKPRSRPPAPSSRPSCPRCRGVLTATSAGKGFLCIACNGELIDHATLAARIEEARARHKQGAGAATPPAGTGAASSHLEAEIRYLACPVCKEPMNRMNFGRRSGVIVDVCKEHGTWLDEGERARVMGFVVAHGLDTEVAVAGGADGAAHPDGAALSPENAAFVRRAEALMTAESLGAQQRASLGLEVADDLLGLLFGSRWSRFERW